MNEKSPKIWVLGGRTPAQHPDFRWFLCELRKSYSYTPWLLVQNSLHLGFVTGNSNKGHRRILPPQTTALVKDDKLRRFETRRVSHK